MVEAKKVALLSIAPIGLGLGLGLYFMKARQTIVTVTASESVHHLCKPQEDTYTITVTITDGFGRPRPFENFTLTTSVDGKTVSTENYTTGPDGKWTSGRMYWYACRASSGHVDAENRATATHTATCRGVAGSCQVVLVLDVCTNLNVPRTVDSTQMYCCL